MLDAEGAKILSRNITPDPTTGIGKWTEAEFVSTLKILRRADGTMLRYPMMPYGMLSDGELKAIYAYLRTVPPIQHKVGG
jgi:hypothetical protein